MSSNNVLNDIQIKEFSNDLFTLFLSKNAVNNIPPTNATNGLQLEIGMTPDEVQRQQADIARYQTIFNRHTTLYTQGNASIKSGEEDNIKDSIKDWITQFNDTAEVDASKCNEFVRNIAIKIDADGGDIANKRFSILMQPSLEDDEQYLMAFTANDRDPVNLDVNNNLIGSVTNANKCSLELLALSWPEQLTIKDGKIINAEKFINSLLILKIPRDQLQSESTQQINEHLKRMFASITGKTLIIDENSSFIHLLSPYISGSTKAKMYRLLTDPDELDKVNIEALDKKAGKIFEFVNRKIGNQNTITIQDN